ncbi:hypothetical protein [Streptomyces sp. B1I3]|uniref:hypothetical protein n=1 Tax=Streptomyces sp. B1I3 TaxID=3042264 RepID=UPI0027800C59|nr:hypothetical protein [Streptomyces sp. B1I3]MDQ0797492.1 hypothetical protein [Streptomyces sp. B1I3]
MDIKVYVPQVRGRGPRRALAVAAGPAAYAPGRRAPAGGPPAGHGCDLRVRHAVELPGLGRDGQEGVPRRTRRARDRRERERRWPFRFEPSQGMNASPPG